MNAKFPRIQAVCRLLSFLTVVVLLAWPGFAKAQSAQPSPTPSDPASAYPYYVLDQQQVVTPTHTITLNRVAPPVFPAPTSTPAVQTNSTPKGPGTQQNGVSSGDEKEYKILFLSATVYDHQFTQLRFYGGGSPELSAYVDIDFNYFRGVTQIETEDTVYLIFFGMGDDTAASLTQAGQTPPNLSTFPQGYSAYQIIAGDTTAHADDLTALDALCAYYDANKVQLIAAYQQRLADQAAHEQWVIDHPPVPPNTTLYFWPAQNSVYLQPSH